MAPVAHARRAGRTAPVAFVPPVAPMGAAACDPLADRMAAAAAFVPPVALMAADPAQASRPAACVPMASARPGPLVALAARVPVATARHAPVAADGPAAAVAVPAADGPVAGGPVVGVAALPLPRNVDPLRRAPGAPRWRPKRLGQSLSHRKSSSKTSPICSR